MKKFRTRLIIYLASAFFAACETGIVDNAILSWDYQEPEYWIRTSEPELEFYYPGGEEQLSVQLSHSQPWTVDISECPWVTLSPTSGKGSTDITVTVREYNRSGVRSGNMVFSFREKKASVAVSQTGFAFLSTDPYIEKLEFPSEGGVSEIGIGSNQEWTATPSDSWITLSPSSGSRNGSVQVTTNANTTTETRSGTVTFKSDDCESTLTVVQEGVQLFIDGHAYVNLGLPSGLLWATCNVGASRPEEYGSYFAWGETEEKDIYTWETLRYRLSGNDGASMTFSKYVTLASRGPVDNRTVLEPSDDAAAVNWGGRWLTPDDDDWTELRNNCTWALSSGYKGYIVTGPNGRSIFLPMAGYLHGTSLYSAGSNGYYWSSSLDVNYPQCAMQITLGNNQIIRQENGTRYWGRSVRPVIQPSSYFNISTQSIEFPSADGTKEITLTTNLLWKVSSDAAWLTVSAPSGKGSATLTVTAEANTFTQSRTGTLTIEAGGESHRVTVTQEASEQKYEEIDGHAYVDLGLPSGLLWATMNVGASAMEDYGSYFAWGETTAKSWYDWTTYKWGTVEQLTKYNWDSTYGIVDDKRVLDSSDDAAVANWGNGWRMPTREEWQELLSSSNTTWVWKTLGGVAGTQVTSLSNGNSVFLPSAGGRWQSALNSTGFWSCYWSTTIYYTQHQAFAAEFWEDKNDALGTGNRASGYSVRPVYQPNPSFELSNSSILF